LHSTRRDSIVFWVIIAFGFASAVGMGWWAMLGGGR
jgi:hypothetical protein